MDKFLERVADKLTKLESVGRKFAYILEKGEDLCPHLFLFKY